MISLKFHSNISLLMLLTIQIWKIYQPLLNYVNSWQEQTNQRHFTWLII